MLSSNFSKKFYILLNILDLLVSVNIHVIKIITSNLADVWYIFPLILLTFHHAWGLVLAVKLYLN